MKTEVLKRIKKTEEEYKATISSAEEEKKKSIFDAKLEADNLVAKTYDNAEEYKKKRLADTRDEAKQKYEEITAEGDLKAAALREQSSSQVQKAVELLVNRFKEQLNV